MISPDDVVDLLWEKINVRLPQAGMNKIPREKGRRIFLSEYEIKRKITQDNILRVPPEAILSPLALDWLVLKGVSILREDS